MQHLQQSTATSPPDRNANPTVAWLRGVAAMGDEQWETALAAFQHFLELATVAKDRQVAYQNLSACYLALERYDQALAILDQAQSESGDDPETMHSRAVIYACAGRIPEAIKAFDYLMRRQPKFARLRQVPEALHSLRKIQRGKAAPGTFLLDYLQEQVSDNLDLAEFAIVEQKARRMIAADPSRPEGHFALGVALLHLERHQDALDAFAVADVCDPDHAPTLYNIAYTHEKMGAYTQAAQWYERTLQHDKKHLAALHHLGRVHQQMAQRDKAVSLWRQALRLQPGYFSAQNSLFEAGEGPKPAEPPLPANYYERERMTPVVKQRMRSPQVFRNGGLTLTFDPQVGYILEDADNQRNGTIHAGGPFKVGAVTLDEDILDLMGLIKLLVRMVNTENTRDIAILIYYANGDMFNYVAQFARGKRTQFDVDGRFIVTEVPRLFKLRMNSDLSTPYGDPMQGLLIYLNQGTEPGRLVSTLGLGVAL